MESVFSARAKEQQIRKPESVIQISEEQKPIVVIKEVAKIANVSHDTIAKVKYNVSLNGGNIKKTPSTKS